MAESRGFDFPFRQGTDAFPQPATGLERVTAQIKQVLLTERGERLMRPNFGSRLREFLFENIDAITVEAVRAEVARALIESDVDVLILEIRVSVENLESTNSRTALVVSVFFDQLGQRGTVGIRLAAGGEVTIVNADSARSNLQ